MVHLLPYERYDLYKEAVRRMTGMLDCLLDHNNCRNFHNFCQESFNLPQQTEESQSQDVEQDVPEGEHHVQLLEDGQPDHQIGQEELPREHGHQELVSQEDRQQSVEEQSDAEQVLELVENEKETQETVAPVQQTLGHTKSKKALKKSPKRMNKKREAYNKCPWLKNHASKASLKDAGTILNLPVSDQFGVPNAGVRMLTRRSYQDMLLNKKENVVDKSDRMLKEVVRDISKRLSDEVFSKDGEEVINRTRTILDFSRLALKIKNEKSSVKVAYIEFPKWIEAVEKIPVEDLKNVPQDELKRQYKLFLSRLEDITKNKSANELENLDAKVLLKQLFDPKRLLFVDIELVLHAVAVASVKSSCESILESYVSQYEVHFNERRNVDEATANEEFEIATNGPNLAQADSVILEAMEMHFKGKPWHFFRTSVLERLVNPSGSSNILKRFDSQQNSLPIMD